MDTKSKSRNFLMTLNNPVEECEDYLKALHGKLGAAYTCGQLEKGANGTPHIQFFMNWKEPIRLSKIKKADNKLHIEVVKINNGAHTYCMKEETRLDGPWEFGTKPVQRNSKQDWEEVKQHALTNQLEKIPADIYVRHYRNLTQIAKDHMVTPQRTFERKCYWLWGETGLGKSKAAFSWSESIYPKMQNKWWDGYSGQKTVVLDEFDKEHRCLFSHLKKWADPWQPFIAEAKNTAMPPDYDIFIVTSNYSLEDLFRDEPDKLNPLLRRFSRDTMSLMITSLLRVAMLCHQ